MPLIDTSQPTEAEQDFSDESLVDGLVDALFPILGGFPYWQTLRDDVRFRCGYNPEAFLRHIKRNSVSELIRACRPALDTSSSYGLNESVTEWVMSTLLAAGRNVHQILELIELIKERGEELEERRELEQILSDRRGRAPMARS
jgi:hypothetical protein